MKEERCPYGYYGKKTFVVTQNGKKMVWKLKPIKTGRK